MATIHPFAALLPQPSIAPRLCELPYDVMSTDEARAIADGNPLSFLRVSKPEIELPPGTDPYAPEVYARGRDNLRRLIDQGALVRDAQPSFYLYRQCVGSHSQTGLVAAASCQEYLDGIIRKHELTRVDKEDDRVRHIDTLNAQTGPVFLTYRAQPEIDTLVSDQTDRPPLVDFTAADNVRHTSWRVADPGTVRRLSDLFDRIPRLYIADGHHRSAAAARVFQARQGAANAAGFLTVIFPHNQMRILPYNRGLKDLNGHSPSRLLALLAGTCELHPGAPASPSAKHSLSLFLDGRWHGLSFRPDLLEGRSGIEALDVTLLQDRILQPLFAIDDPRTSHRIQFIGGIRGTDELEHRVQNGEFACAFSMHPTGIEDLMAIADAGGIMPPKSTWFEPKLRDAMFCLMLGPG
ncbi:MAG: DUF1015 domain-containing protein [Verrucomicrobiae bacterium]|nr:DUF1015 domain-containing protein [Verrucomicrobiae bacterium]